MRTEELVQLLAAGNEASDQGRPLRRLVLGALVGTAIATLAMSACLGVRPTLVDDARGALFWIKEAFCLGLSVAGLVAVVRLGRPGRRLGATWFGVAGPLAVMWLLATWMLFAADPSQRSALLLGQTSNVCSERIALISMPPLVAMMVALRAWAPTRLALAGASVGFGAGSIGALVYSLHCPELEPPFLSVWYVLGILIPTAIGAGLGPRVLRW
jgi:hypothetical protein